MLFSSFAYQLHFYMMEELCHPVRYVMQIILFSFFSYFHTMSFQNWETDRSCRVQNRSSTWQVRQEGHFRTIIGVHPEEPVTSWLMNALVSLALFAIRSSYLHFTARVPTRNNWYPKFLLHSLNKYLISTVFLVTSSVVSRQLQNILS